MKKINENEMRTIVGGKSTKRRCPNCGDMVSDNAILRALHWVVKGCWGFC